MQRGLRKQTIRTLTLLLVVGCSEPAPPHSGAERFAPVAHDLFTAAARRDNERLRLLAADSMTYNWILALAETHPDLIADASHGVVPQKAPLRVEADTAYIVYMPHGRYLQRNLLAVRFVRAGSTWLVDYVGFQEPLDGF